MFIFAHDKVGVFAEMDILAPIEPLLAEDALGKPSAHDAGSGHLCGTLYQLPLYFETLLFFVQRALHARGQRARDHRGIVPVHAGQHGPRALTALWSSTPRPTTPPPGSTALAARSSPRMASRSRTRRRCRTRLPTTKSSSDSCPGNGVRHGEHALSGGQGRQHHRRAMDGAQRPRGGASLWASPPCRWWTRPALRWRPIPACRACMCLKFAAENKEDSGARRACGPCGA